MTTSGHSSMGYENPAFKIRIVSPNDSLQPPRGTKEQMGIAIGDVISAKIKGTVIDGKVISVKKTRDGKSVQFVTIVTQNDKRYRVNVTQISMFNNVNTGGEEQRTSSPAVFAESKLLSFKQFLTERETVTR